MRPQVEPEAPKGDIHDIGDTVGQAGRDAIVGGFVMLEPDRPLTV